ncbi:ABC-type transport auxiliary lipoprotein family protein [Cribrihabitans neustonicus]|uniref:ABC-type transport auxiliary lipoprotein family protein n=1 Tax=Cribrihabitans neustonicus TaxID=1429085 RepID=UPI003B5C9987
MTAMIRLLLMLLVLPFAPAGCTALSALGEASQPLDVYELRTPEVPRSGARRNVELIVEEPIASGALAVERIMIRPSPLQVQYLPGARWADPAPIMLQTLMVRSLTQTGAFNSVGRGPIGTVADYAVLSELTDFQAETDDDGETAVIRVRAVLRLIRESDTKAVASQTFSVTVNTGPADTDAIVAAFDAAISRLIPDVVSWIIRSTSRS